jgi:nitrilase
MRLHRDLHTRLVNNAVRVPSATTAKLCAGAKRAKLNVVIGVNELSTDGSGASVYNTILYISEEGEIIGKHRKLVPTGPERMVWAQGDGSTLAAYDMPVGRVGGLICWENYMPLARYAMYAWGTQVYVAPTWDRGDMWQSTLRHIAKEGGVYTVGCSIAIRKSDIPEEFGLKVFYTGSPDWINVGDSAIIDPDGRVLAGPAREEETILLAEADLAGIPGPKWMFDVAGHYARPDVFQLIVDRNHRPIVTPALGDGAAPAHPRRAAQAGRDGKTATAPKAKADAKNGARR